MKLNNINKVIITLTIFGFMLWFGGSFLRSAVAYDLLTPTTNFQLKTNYSDEIRMHSVYLFATMAPYTTIGYILAFLGVIAISVINRKNLKRLGWLFMSILLFLLFSPIEFMKIYYDSYLSWYIYVENIKDFNHPLIQEYFLYRFRNMMLNTLSGLSFMGNLTIIFFLVWRPLHKEI